MTTWYNAQRSIVEAANADMAEIAEGHSENAEDTIRNIWEPVANALNATIREDLVENWPEHAKLADAQGPDFVGMTNEGDIVAWGETIRYGTGPHRTYRPFVIMQPESHA